MHEGGRSPTRTTRLIYPMGTVFRSFPRLFLEGSNYSNLTIDRLLFPDRKDMYDRYTVQNLYKSLNYSTFDKLRNTKNFPTLFGNKINSTI